jgi:hypothetical protein
MKRLLLVLLLVGVASPAWAADGNTVYKACKTPRGDKYYIVRTNYCTGYDKHSRLNDSTYEAL